jgi:effector-binding domain-containing protein
MIEAPQIAETKEQDAAIIHLKIPRAQCEVEFPRAVQEVMAALGKQGLTPAGPLFDHHLTHPSTTFNFEVGFPVSRRVSPTGRVKGGRLPASKVVRTVYHGGYEGLPQAWAQFNEQAKRLVEGAGLEVCDSLWQVYLVGPADNSDPNAWRTELNVPLVERTP